MWRRELLERPEVMRTIIDRVPTIILVLDDSGRIAKVNRHFERLTGFSAEEVLGKDWFTTFLPKEERRDVRDVFERVMASGENPGHINNILTAGGKLLSVEWFAQVIADSEHRTRWLLNVGHDITQRLEYEHALEVERREADRANMSKTRFLVSASHDLRQPLQALMILNESLARVARNTEQRELVKMQQDALNGMRDLLNALLDIGRLESGAISPEIRNVPLNEVFEVVRAELEPLAVEKGLELLVEATPVVVSTDATLLMQLLQNVVGNAIRYTPDGSVRLSSAPNGDRVEISVADTGTGIAEDQLELIFDEFYQVDDTDSRGGLGLGLSIVRRIAELLELKIELESELGRGTTFHINVPAAEVDAPSESQPSASPSYPSTGTLLLVDDDAAVLGATKLLFEMAGFTVITAASPDEVMERLDAGVENIGLIVTDYHLGEKRTGIDIVAAVREREGCMVPAIILTGDTSPKAWKTELGSLEVMSKPAAPDRLIAKIQYLLNGSDAEKENDCRRAGTR